MVGFFVFAMSGVLSLLWLLFDSQRDIARRKRRPTERDERGNPLVPFETYSEEPRQRRNNNG